MEKYIKEASKQTPAIEFDFKQGILSIKGRSTPENAVSFYKELLDALEVYTNTPAILTNVTIELEYFDTPSSAAILGIFKKLENIQKNGNVVIVNWNYEDEDMLDSGQDYQKVIKIPFKMVSVVEE